MYVGQSFRPRKTSRPVVKQRLFLKPLKAAVCVVLQACVPPVLLFWLGQPRLWITLIFFSAAQFGRKNLWPPEWRGAGVGRRKISADTALFVALALPAKTSLGDFVSSCWHRAQPLPKPGPYFRLLHSAYLYCKTLDLDVLLYKSAHVNYICDFVVPFFLKPVLHSLQSSVDFSHLH